MPTQARFGRRFAPDPRDRLFHLPRAAEPSRLTQKTWFTRAVFDQGNTSKCVAYAGAGWLVAGPVNNPAPPPFDELYRDCQDNDEWEGNSYEGTSVRGLMKVFKRRGYVSEYRWAWSLEPAVNHVLDTGPMVFGTNWYTGMMEADEHGFVHVGGELAGGHAYLVIGANRLRECPDGSKGAIRIVNSWGRAWGQAGRAWISFADAQRLLELDGEAATAWEAVLPPVA